jgi:3-oxoacyl-[acyl-carrier protein] reductase
MDLGLKNKRALVTGASRGLGYAVARLLAAEGCTVAVNSRGPEAATAAAKRIAAETGSLTVGLAGDVADPAVPGALVGRVESALGGLDILVLNAGGPPSGPFESFDDMSWQRAVEITLLSKVRLVRAALPFLRRSEAASVLAIASYSVKQPIPNLVLSNSIRAAVTGLMKSLALELGAEGIRFNAILPAWTETERFVELLEARAQRNGTALEEEIAKQSAESVFGRMAHPEEFANAAVFLVSPAASYITGVMLTVDGGMYKGTF